MNLGGEARDRPPALRGWASTSSRPASPSPRPATSRRSRPIAEEVTGPRHLRPGALHRARTSTAPARRVKGAETPRIHVFLATSAIHLRVQAEDGAGRDRPTRARWRAWRASWRDVCRRDVEFSPEDASRTELDFLAEVRRSAPSRPAPRRSTSPTPSATPCRSSYGDVIRT